jgi:hypothetical protein
MRQSMSVLAGNLADCCVQDARAGSRACGWSENQSPSGWRRAQAQSARPAMIIGKLSH